MRRSLTFIVVAWLAGAGAAVAQGGGAPAKAKATTPEIPFESVANFFKMPAGLYMGEGVGVATNSKGHVFVYVRSGETRLFEFDQNGAFVKEFGVGSYGFAFARVASMTTTLAVDEGTNVIQKFSPDGKLLLVLGKRPDPLDQLAQAPGGGQYSGANRPYSFHRQTDVAWDPQGNIFVSDGYGDSRVVKYDKNGRFIKSAGTRGNGPLQFSTPHAIAVDAKGIVYVADRGLVGRRSRQRPESEGRLRRCRRAVGRLHLAGPASVSLQLQFVPDRQQLRPGAGDRRGLQDGARWQSSRPVWQGGTRLQGVQQHPPDGLPQSRRGLRRRDHSVARAKDPAAPAAGADVCRKVRHV